jgi:type I restriction enzyme M protein
MNNQVHNQIVSFIWGIADDCLRDVYVRGKYRDVILPMTVIRRLDAVLEPTKDEVLRVKKMLDDAGVTNQTVALCNAAGQSFCNSSPFKLKDLASRAKQQTLKSDFTAYLDGFSPNVQEILEKFKFRNQLDTMVDADILGSVIGKFIDPSVNISPNPLLNDDGSVKLPALDNHTMGTIFEELIRRFNEENNEEAGEHFTPRDVVELMADLIFQPIADKIMDAPYLVYDGASGTGGMLTVSQDRLLKLAADNGKTVSIHLFGQEINPETYAITKADLLLKGEGGEAEHIGYGSTLSNDQNPSRQFDFMLSNPPYGKSWKNDADKLGGKKGIIDSRFVTSFAGDGEFSMMPRTSDGQLLFLLNNVSKMKEQTELGSRIAEVHNGSSLFTGDAGQGESNARRYLIERDLVEAIIALPENMFYNTHLATYIWILSNRKPAVRRGKIQLINAMQLKRTLKKNLGKKNCELTEENRQRIVEMFLNMEENEFSVILPNSSFGYFKIPLLTPMYDFNGKPLLDKKGRAIHDKDKPDFEKIPFDYPGGVDAYLQNEVRPFRADSWLDIKNAKIGYEVRFTKYFKNESDRRDVEDLETRIARIDEILARQMDFLERKAYSEYSGVEEIWFSELPKHWKAIKIKYLFEERSEKGYPDEPLLAATQNMGVVPKDVYGQRTVEASKDLHLLKLVKPNDFVISLRSFQGGIEKAYYQGIISPAYTILACKGLQVEYFKHLAKSPVFISLLQQCVTGIREGQNIDYNSTLKNIRIPVPPEDEQRQIAAVLDSIDARIDARKKEIELLKSYKSSIMSDVVIGKLDVRSVVVPEFEASAGLDEADS